MSFKAILYREFEIVKKYCISFILSYVSNAFFIIILFLIFRGIIFFEKLDQEGFLLISYLRVITQTQIFCAIYNQHDKQEKIFETVYLNFILRVKALFGRFIFVLFFNLLFLLEFYSWASFGFSTVEGILLFILTYIIIILNHISINHLVTNCGNKFITYFSQIFLLPINFSAFLIMKHTGNLILIIFSLFLSIANGLTVSFFTDQKQTKI